MNCLLSKTAIIVACSLVLCSSSCGSEFKSPLEHETGSPRCDTMKTGREGLDDTMLAAIAALNQEGYPVYSVNTGTNTVYSEYAYPRNVMLQWEIVVKGPAEAVVSAVGSGLEYEGRAWSQADGFAMRLANIMSRLYCLPHEELVEKAAAAGVKFPFQNQRESEK